MLHAAATPAVDSLHVFDAQIAAVCEARSATLATRNVKDFEDTGVTVVDPWNT